MKKPMIKLEIELSKTLPKFDFIKNTSGITKAGIILFVLLAVISIAKNGITGSFDSLIILYISSTGVILSDMLRFVLIEHERQNFDLGKYLAELEKRIDFE